MMLDALITMSSIRSTQPKILSFPPALSLADDVQQEPGRRRTWQIIASILALGCVAVILVWVPGGKRLPDGSWLTLHQVIVAGEVSCNFPDASPSGRMLRRLIPGWVRSVLPGWLGSDPVRQGGAELNMSGDGKVCLFVVTDRKGMDAAGKLDLTLLTVSDDQGQGTKTSPAVVTVDARQRFQGWAWEDFPKRSRNLLVRCWATGPDGQTAEVAHFRVRNPGYEPGTVRKAP
jgi:hypothetical protein